MYASGSPNPMHVLTQRLGLGLGAFTDYVYNRASPQARKPKPSHTKRRKPKIPKPRNIEISHPSKAQNNPRTLLFFLKPERPKAVPPDGYHRLDLVGT